MKSYFVEAADVLFFRDGREIQAGTEYSAASVFPPNPATFYGALRTAIIGNVETGDFGNKKDFGLTGEARNLVGSASEMGELVIGRFGLARKKGNHIERLFRLPNDVLTRKKAEPKTLTTLKQKDLSEFGLRMNSPIGTLQSSWFTAPEGEFYEGEGSFVNESLFRKYLSGKLEKDDWKLFIPLKDVFLSEPRMGIVINDETRTVEDGKLFTTPFIRPKYDTDYQIGFVFESNMDEAQMPASFLFRLGGDGKLAQLQQWKEETAQASDLLNKIAVTKTFKMVVTTPAVFEKGWLPVGIDEISGEGLLSGVNVKLIGGSIGRYQIVSGWDVANNRPKPALRAVPPGSVYTFEITGGDAASLKPFLTGASLCANKEYQKQGLGISYLGVL